MWPWRTSEKGLKLNAESIMEMRVRSSQAPVHMHHGSDSATDLVLDMRLCLRCARAPTAMSITKVMMFGPVRSEALCCCVDGRAHRLRRGRWRRAFTVRIHKVFALHTLLRSLCVLPYRVCCRRAPERTHLPKVGRLPVASMPPASHSFNWKNIRECSYANEAYNN